MIALKMFIAMGGLFGFAWLIDRALSGLALMNLMDRWRS